MIAFNLACYSSVAGRMQEAKERLQRAINLIKVFADWRSMMRIEAVMGLDQRFEIVGRTFQVPDCSLFTTNSSTSKMSSRHGPDGKLPRSGEFKL